MAEDSSQLQTPKPGPALEARRCQVQEELKEALEAP